MRGTLGVKQFPMAPIEGSCQGAQLKMCTLTHIKKISHIKNMEVHMHVQSREQGLILNKFTSYFEWHSIPSKYVA